MTGPTAAPAAAPDMQRAVLRPVAHPGVALRPGFWGAWQHLNRNVAIPHGIAQVHAAGSVENLELAAGARGDYHLPHFRDADVYTVLQAAVWERAHGPDAGQQAFVDEVADVLGRAITDEGYLNSYVQVVRPGEQLTNPENNELFCAGHLFQAAVADVRTSSRPVLLETACRYADYLVEHLLGDRSQFVPEHPQIEMALVELYRATGHRPYLDLADSLLRRRGQGRLIGAHFELSYYQDDVPFEQADTIRGHAVRAVYLAAGAVDVYLETGDRVLLDAAVRQWEDMVGGKTYLTGGIGSRREDESFGDRFELPPDRAYCETCAAIGSIQLSWRLLLATGERRYADLIERTLFNAFLVGLGADGASFFYVNVLRSNGTTPSVKPQQSLQYDVRQPWYEVACCPPNIMRTLATLENYLSTSADDGLQLHQYAAADVAAELTTGTLRVQVDTDYPWDGRVRVTVLEAPASRAALSLRVPAWAPSCSVAVNGERLAPDVRDGYAVLARDWAPGDTVELVLAMPARWVAPDPRIDAVRGSVALERGPLVYCLEAVDVPGGTLVDLYVPAAVPPVDVAVRRDVAGMSVVPLTFTAVRLATTAAPWPYAEVDRGPAARDGEPVEVTAVPYFVWANRGATEMRVWLPRTDWAAVSGTPAPDPARP